MKHLKLLILLVCMAFSANALAEFKLYDVDPSYREEVYQALAGVLRAGADDSPTNAIELLPTGQILIDSTPETHQQVAAVLAEIRRHEAEPTPRVTLQYWVVLGNRALGPAADTPAVLDDVLDEITQVHGPLSFQLLGNATLKTDSGMRGRTQGEVVVDQTAYVQGTRLHAHLQIGYSYQMGGNNVWSNQSLELDTSMEQGEFVVVGENSIRGNMTGQGEVDGTIFYIVHWAAAD